MITPEITSTKEELADRPDFVAQFGKQWHSRTSLIFYSFHNLHITLNMAYSVIVNYIILRDV